MTEINKQILDKLNDMDERLKKSERSNNVIAVISFGLIAMIFSTAFFTIQPNIGTAWLLFITGIVVITAYGWYPWFLSQKRKLRKSKK